MPDGFNIQEFRIDVQLVESLYPLLHAVETLYGKLTDTYFAAGSEAYAAALLVYQYAKAPPCRHRRPGGQPRRPCPPLRPQVQQDHSPGLRETPMIALDGSILDMKRRMSDMERSMLEMDQWFFEMQSWMLEMDLSALFLNKAVNVWHTNNK